MSESEHPMKITFSESAIQALSSDGLSKSVICRYNQFVPPNHKKFIWRVKQWFKTYRIDPQYFINIQSAQIPGKFEEMEQQQGGYKTMYDQENHSVDKSPRQHCIQ